MALSVLKLSIHGVLNSIVTHSWVLMLVFDTMRDSMAVTAQTPSPCYIPAGQSSESSLRGRGGEEVIYKYLIDNADLLEITHFISFSLQQWLLILEKM